MDSPSLQADPKTIPGTGPASPESADPAFLFLHIFKTGGTSLLFMLDEIFPPGTSCPERSWPHLLRIPRAQLSTYRLFRGHFGGGFGRFLGRPVREFTLLRHPVARAVSQHRYVLRTGTNSLHDRFVALGSLRACLRDAEIGRTFSNLQAKVLAEVGVPGSTTMGARWDGTEDALREAALRRLQQMECVGTMERYNEFLTLMCDVFDWNPPTRMLHLNVDPVPHPEPLSPGDHQLLLEMNAVDLDLFNYANQRMTEQRAAIDAERRANPYAWLEQRRRRIDGLAARSQAQAEQLEEMDSQLNRMGVRMGLGLQRLADFVLPPGTPVRNLAKPLGDAFRRATGRSR